MIRLATSGAMFRRQWLALSLALACCECVRAEWLRTPEAERSLPGLEDGEDLERVLGRILVARGRCVRRFASGDGLVHLDQAQWRVMQRALSRIGRVIEAEWPGSAVPARAWLNATLLVIEDVAAQIPAKPVERRLEWIGEPDGLLPRILALYTLYDPAWTSEEIEAGARVGEMIRPVVFG